MCVLCDSVCGLSRYHMCILRVSGGQDDLVFACSHETCPFVLCIEHFEFLGEKVRMAATYFTESSAPLVNMEDALTGSQHNTRENTSDHVETK